MSRKAHRDKALRSTGQASLSGPDGDGATAMLHWGIGQWPGVPGKHPIGRPRGGCGVEDIGGRDHSDGAERVIPLAALTR